MATKTASEGEVKPPCAIRSTNQDARAGEETPQTVIRLLQPAFETHQKSLSAARHSTPWAGRSLFGAGRTVTSNSTR